MRTILQLVTRLLRVGDVVSVREHLLDASNVTETLSAQVAMATEEVSAKKKSYLTQLTNPTAHVLDASLSAIELVQQHIRTIPTFLEFASIRETLAALVELATTMHDMGPAQLTDTSALFKYIEVWHRNIIVSEETIRSIR